jgi:hypothetical protein
VSQLVGHVGKSVAAEYHWCMTAEEELASLKAHLDELSLEHPRWEEEEGSRGYCQGQNVGRTTHWSSGRQPGSARGETGLPEGPRATAGKRKAKELDLSDSGGLMVLATRRPGHCPEPGPRLCHHR